MSSIINTQDVELVVHKRDKFGCIPVYMRVGEDGMGYNRSQSTTVRLTPAQVRQMIADLQAALDA